MKGDTREYYVWKNHFFLLNQRSSRSSPLIPWSAGTGSLGREPSFGNNLYYRSKAEYVLFSGQKMDTSGSPWHRQLIWRWLPSPPHLEQESLLNKRQFRFSECVFLVKYWVKNCRSAQFLTDRVWLLKFAVLSRGWASVGDFLALQSTEADTWTGIQAMGCICLGCIFPKIYFFNYEAFFFLFCYCILLTSVEYHCFSL